MYRILRHILFYERKIFLLLLKLNDNGSLVELLQLGLIRSGFLSGEPDGFFGNRTKEAVINFQKAFGLDPDGIAGPKTFGELKKYITGYYIKTVSKGETLWSIAAMAGISLDSLITANPDIDPDSITTGQKITVPFSFELVPSDISYSSLLTSLIIDGMTARFPFINKTVIGKSVTGKDITALSAGRGKNRIFINSGFHANEWLNIPVTLKFFEEYLTAVSKDSTICGFGAAELFKNTAVHLIPLVNPDGTDIATRALTQGEYFDKAEEISRSFPDVPFPEGWKANINGTDLNLQFPAGWEKAKAIKYAQGFTKPSPIEFVGFGPLTEPESRAVYDYTLKNDFRMILAYHSQGSIIYWKYGEFLPPESERIGYILSEKSGYPLELTPPDSSFAGYKDWFIQDFNRPGYTIETGLGKNPLPTTQFDKIYEENKPLLAAAIYETKEL